MRVTAVPDREREIGRRLAEFRHALKIPRTAFALAVGVGPERLASYEAGRVPLRYQVFTAITERHLLNPIWLATGQGEMFLRTRFDADAFASRISPRALFSEAFDAVLSAGGRHELERIDSRAYSLAEHLGEFNELGRAGLVDRVPAGAMALLRQQLQEACNLFTLSDEYKKWSRAARTVPAESESWVKLGGPAGHLRYIRQRLECLLQVIQYCDRAELEAALDRFNELARTDRRFGKIFGQVGEVISQVGLLKMELQQEAQRASAATPTADVKAK